MWICPFFNPRWDQNIFSPCVDSTIKTIFYHSICNTKKYFFLCDRWCRCTTLCLKRRRATVRSLTWQWSSSQVIWYLLSHLFVFICHNFINLSACICLFVLLICKPCVIPAVSSSFCQVFFFYEKRLYAHLMFCSSRQNGWGWEDLQAENKGFVSTIKSYWLSVTISCLYTEHFLTSYEPIFTSLLIQSVFVINIVLIVQLNCVLFIVCTGIRTRTMTQLCQSWISAC